MSTSNKRQIALHWLKENKIGVNKLNAEDLRLLERGGYDISDTASLNNTALSDSFQSHHDLKPSDPRFQLRVMDEVNKVKHAY